MNFNEKWKLDNSYQFLQNLIRHNLQSDENLGINKENYHLLPKVWNKELNLELIDLSGIDLKKLSFKKVWMGHYLVYANLSGSKFYRTHFHDAIAHHANFSDSSFERVQFIPFFSSKANYSNCTFENCLGFGSGGDPKLYSSYNDFTYSNFENSIINNSDFSKSNFSNSDFHNSRISNSKFHGSIFFNSSFKNSIFENCSFRGLIYNNANDLITNFRSVKFYNAKFINCDFEDSCFDKSNEIKSLIDNGSNFNLDKILWK